MVKSQLCGPAPGYRSHRIPRPERAVCFLIIFCDFWDYLDKIAKTCPVQASTNTDEKENCVSKSNKKGPTFKDKTIENLLRNPTPPCLKSASPPSNAPANYWRFTPTRFCLDALSRPWKRAPPQLTQTILKKSWHNFSLTSTNTRHTSILDPLMRIHLLFYLESNRLVMLFLFCEWQLLFYIFRLHLSTRFVFWRLSPWMKLRTTPSTGLCLN